MATYMHNLSDYDKNAMPSGQGMKVGIVVAEWNSQFTFAMLRGAVQTLFDNGVSQEDIEVKYVPGSFELVYGATKLLQEHTFDAIIAIGCVIRGDTPHFDYICQGTTQGLTELNLRGVAPVIYGLLTCNNAEQAEMRCGGSLGNKGDECAIAAIKMAHQFRLPEIDF